MIFTYQTLIGSWVIRPSYTDQPHWELRWCASEGDWKGAGYFDSPEEAAADVLDQLTEWNDWNLWHDVPAGIGDPDNWDRQHLYP